MGQASTDLVIQHATRRDLPEMVAMIERKRASYEKAEPVMWRRSASAARWTRLLFGLQLLRSRAVALVACSGERVRGFLIARPVRVPPVFAPGGSTIFVDDFCIEPDADWEQVGGGMLNALCRMAPERRWAQILVVSGTADQAKMEFLAARGLSNASTWWTMPFEARR